MQYFTDGEEKVSAEVFLQKELETLEKHNNSSSVFRSIVDYAFAYKSGKVLPSELLSKVTLFSILCIGYVAK